MSDSYSFSLTTFSPSGQLKQVDHALAAVAQGTTSLGVKASNGVVIATEKKQPSPLVDDSMLEKVALICPTIGCVYSGMGPDYRQLVTAARKSAQAYWKMYNEYPPTRVMVSEIATIMQGATQKGGMRPYGCSLLVAGYDKTRGSTLYQVDPSGSYWAWKASAMGKNMVNAKTFLEKRYNDEISLEDAIHTSLLTLKEGFEGQMTEKTVDIGIIQIPNEWDTKNPPDALAGDKAGHLPGMPVFRKLTEEEIKDHLTFIQSQKKLLDGINKGQSDIITLIDDVQDRNWLKSLALSAVSYSIEIQKTLIEGAIKYNEGNVELVDRKTKLELYDILSISINPVQEDDDDDDPWNNDEEEKEPGEQQQVIELPRFLIMPPERLALEFAAKGEINRLNVLLDKYPDTTNKYQFAILDAIPISVPPTAYLNILPSDEQVTDWYINRATRMDAVGRQLDNALSLIQHGAARGVLGLDKIGEDLILLLRMAEYNHAVGLKDLQSMSYDNSIEAYMIGSTPQDFSTRIKKAILPYLYVLESQNERDTGIVDNEFHERLLTDILLNAGVTNVLSILEASRPDLSLSERVLKDDKYVVALALAAIYTNDRSDILDIIQRVFECMPAWEGGSPTRLRNVVDLKKGSASAIVQHLKNLEIADLGSLLDHLDIHIESLEILARWSINISLLQLELSDYNQQLNWAKTLTRRSVGVLGENIESGSEWEALLDDMVKLSDNEDGRALGLLENDVVVKTFFSGLLNSGKFDLAKELLSSSDSALSSLDKKVVTDIVLETSQEFFDNATDGDLSYGYMKLSNDVLDVDQAKSQTITSHKEFIWATSKLCSYNLKNIEGMQITPLEVRLESNKMVFIDQLLNTRRDGYQHPDRIISLAVGLDDALRYNSKGQVDVLSRIIDAAIRYQDYKEAYRITQSEDFQQKLTLAQDEEDARWISYYKLGIEEKWKSHNERLNCLAQAMTLCPDTKIDMILSEWKKLDSNLSTMTVNIPEKKKEKDASDALASILSPITVESQTRNLLSGGLRALKSVGSVAKNEIIASTQPPQPPAMATPSLEFNRDIGKTDRVYHPFDTYKFVTTLQGYGYSRRISEIIMVATRTLLVQHALIARSSLMTREDMENSSYLFKAALTELRVELSIRGRADASALRSLTTALTREVDGLEQKMKEDVGSLKDDIELDMNNRKDETQSDGKAFEINVQSLNNRITVATGELRTEVERDKWDTTIRVVGVIFFEAVCIVAAVLLSDPEDVAKQKQVQTRLPTAEELGIRPTDDDIQERVI
ncbi:hypothetical protein E3Q24_01244 [Wallemia mellicola]|nr:hypothetical protein E3Q24_01244 [Wallemia mellicola]